MTYPLSYGHHLKQVLVLGLPLAGSQLAQIALSLVDTAMLGWYDPTALAAQTLASGLFLVLLLASSGFASALPPLVAGAEARGDTTQARRLTRMALWLSVIAGLVSLPILLSAEPIFLALGQKPEIAALAGDYLDVLAWGIFPALATMVLKSYLSALERSHVVLAVMLVALVINAAANYALIFGNWGLPELGVTGAAIASLLMHLATMIFLCGYVQKVLPEQALFQRLWKSDPESLARVFRLGWPIGLTMVAEVGLFGTSSVFMGWLGETALAAHGIALQVTSVIFMVHLGLSQAATIRAGQSYGRGAMADLVRGAKAAIGLSMLAVLTTSAVIIAVPEVLVGLFLDPNAPGRDEIIAVGRVFLIAAALFQLTDALQVMALGLLRGLQDTRRPMIFAAISYWVVGAPAAWYLSSQTEIGGVGVWLGLAAGLTLAAVSMMTRFWRSVVPAARAALEAEGAVQPASGGSD
ncbi:multidrug resistance protein, MATE family [Pseudooceanicola antarcticus]|uniref:Multidrug-efflux transporter n=1 Tax=Pseudooceanicola antarcticus TaxID=1247613 RepID=A0A285IRS4_9RHOB|nr:MATE family efflux transporter [Pseudooceanicola antarcticus]PJE32122.1 MATE family efflux transporter [Pseudooceanicola antarcticus]SNY50730.1 multidrug resistance protein, MATE family [Pseudooceanicola antarcticus]